MRANAPEFNGIPILILTAKGHELSESEQPTLNAYAIVGKRHQLVTEFNGILQPHGSFVFASVPCVRKQSFTLLL